MFTSSATESGRAAGLAVLSGALDVEEAGDLWVKTADGSHAAGVAWMRAFDATGASR